MPKAHQYAPGDRSRLEAKECRATRASHMNVAQICSKPWKINVHVIPGPFHISFGIQLYNHSCRNIWAGQERKVAICVSGTGKAAPRLHGGLVSPSYATGCTDHT